MNEMIERVSEAILNTPNASDYPILVARNAIKAMREPTEDMSFAGAEASGEDYLPIAIKCYQAMIDKALEE